MIRVCTKNREVALDGKPREMVVISASFYLITLRPLMM